MKAKVYFLLCLAVQRSLPSNSIGKKCYHKNPTFWIRILVPIYCISKGLPCQDFLEGNYELFQKSVTESFHLFPLLKKNRKLPRGDFALFPLYLQASKFSKAEFSLPFNAFLEKKLHLGSYTQKSGKALCAYQQLTGRNSFKQNVESLLQTYSHLFRKKRASNS